MVRYEFSHCFVRSKGLATKFWSSTVGSLGSRMLTHDFGTAFAYRV